MERVLLDFADVPAESFVFKVFDLKPLLLVDRKHPGLRVDTEETRAQILREPYSLLETIDLSWKIRCLDTFYEYLEVATSKLEMNAGSRATSITFEVRAPFWKECMGQWT